MKPPGDYALAHGLARLGLGANIALHGYTRLPDPSGFASGLREQFAQSILPPSLVYASGYGIAVGEVVIGTSCSSGSSCARRSRQERCSWFSCLPEPASSRTGAWRESR